MQIMAIEASGPVAGVALVRDHSLLAEYECSNHMTHSESLVPMMEEVRERLSLDLTTLDALAITRGPGSFTGLRIGAATIKGVGLALNKPVIGLSTLESLAFNLYGTDALVCPLMDARRGQVYAGIYREKDEPEEVLAPCAVPVEEILTKLNDLGERVIFLGDGVPVSKEKIESLVKVPYSFAPAHMNRQRAASTAVLAEHLLETKGESVLVSADDFRPEYLRKSQAEKQREEAEAKGEMEALAAGRMAKDPHFHA
ncbi:MAG TPA: tRNA (adenosine(37)-N6)-threonylcarbamoyltransferase complex dimerization subunit type 1 TsaB [Lachnospiraceae bacterium]|jgi:tRNA threonylcarbamoyladenosine biosynthesis protein TsaB|nr:tRNA (adenosine(37)-N6)-threonylcarbamoyltransferase complex dimerization subunit type 1 TsaB [Lachnospiraceae bacterium]